MDLGPIVDNITLLWRILSPCINLKIISEPADQRSPRAHLDPLLCTLSAMDLGPGALSDIVTLKISTVSAMGLGPKALSGIVAFVQIMFDQRGNVEMWNIMKYKGN